mmetsp:Transcript_64009/g.113852  ORF Transcript_64009/g.113852 Transcript_64009/m.113852 type:complete len:341 (+) Transcript_64009:48-1070(+)|eukprot:CAMPEP_0197654298 /NCGR_PEP_ID=MMETSP1338-20131121/38766_1 /TAXON_ID=43686 ORGANISM="Pelagodinium beii, Strain RCC1491" /NCGR_SAMPLE_ID=MMETSP1338 /ASSEMBLY_ACC=CAM_ASM_000754 /LENGTH=340 /DNA_ID=CAMNT_0043229715 /DNA_START=47 /DNA_END=1069 /DNA_ORIENTATION=-
MDASNMDASTAEAPSPNKLVMAQLSKTKMCIMFTRGACHDDKCSFAHCEAELREQPDLAKTAICRAFSRGECQDKDCKYAHGEEELRVSPSVYKTQLCRFHARGNCKKADRCRHAHGRRELRSFQAEAPPAPSAVPVAPPGLTPVRTPTRPARQARVTLADISNLDTPEPKESLMDTPEKLSPWPVKVLFPELPKAPAAPGLVKQHSRGYEHSAVSAAVPGLPIHWVAPELQEDLNIPSGLPTPPMSVEEMAAAAAVAAIQAREHTAAANAAQAAAVTLAHAAATVQGKGLPSTPAALPTASEVQHFMAFLQQFSGQPPAAPPASSGGLAPVPESRKWVL